MTFERIRKRFYGPGHRKTTEDYVKSCYVWQQRLGPGPKPAAQLKPIQADYPFKLIALDVLDLPRTDRGNKYCLVVSDYYTKWPEVFALPDQQASAMAFTLTDGLLSRHGLTTTIHSDQGRSFENDL